MFQVSPIGPQVNFFSGPLWYPSASFYLMLTHIMQRSKYDALQFMLQGAAAV